MPSTSLFTGREPVYGPTVGTASGGIAPVVSSEDLKEVLGYGLNRKLTPADQAAQVWSARRRELEEAEENFRMAEARLEDARHNEDEAWRNLEAVARPLQGAKQVAR